MSAVAVLLTGAAVLAGATALLARGEDPARSVPAAQEAARVPSQSAAGERRRWPLAARLLRRVQLRERPRGAVVRALAPRTGYGSPRILAVVARRPGWLGVLSQHMPNSRAGWIPVAAVALLYEPFMLHVDLSARRLVVRREGRAVRRITVAIGRPGTETPTGRFAITDVLRITAANGAYGCCALALTGRQPNVPQGWSGGDRIAIHGTANEATLGTPASGGCLRASDRDMRWLMKTIPLGTQVRIRA